MRASGARARTPRTSAAVVAGEALHLAVDVAVGIAACGAAIDRCGDRVGVVAAGEDRHHGAGPRHERHGVLEKVARDAAAVLVSDCLDRGAEHPAGDAEVRQRHRRAVAAELARDERHVATAVRAGGEWQARGAAADPDRVARADGGVRDRRAWRRSGRGSAAAGVRRCYCTRRAERQEREKREQQSHTAGRPEASTHARAYSAGCLIYRWNMVG